MPGGNIRPDTAMLQSCMTFTYQRTLREADVRPAYARMAVASNFKPICAVVYTALFH